MCTLSVLRDADKIQITVNRDEQLSRQAEIAPHLWRQEQILAPKDIESSGTWIGVNPSSKTWACLLNNYASHESCCKSDSPISRGGIVPLALSRVIAVVTSNIEPYRYRPFALLLGDNHSVYESCWDCL